MWNYFDAGRHERVADSGSLKPHKEDYGGLVDPQRHYANETVTDENTGGNTSTSTSSTSTWMGVVSRPPLSADQPPSHAITDHGEPRSRPLPPLLLASTRGAESENKPQASTVVSTATAAAVSTDMVAAPAKVKKKRIRIKTERRREQCRLNQARYRNKQRSFAVDLEQTVEQLQQQVLQLEAQRRSLYFSVNTRDSATCAVVEYFRYFGGGLTLYEPRPGSSRPALEKQIVFVTSVFHHNTRVGDDYGSEFFLEQWRRFSTFYGGLRILPQRYTPQSKPEIATVVEADVILQVTITETTIRQLYPHLLHWRYNGIKWKLLGRRINFSSVLGFDFDEDGKVTCVEWTIDFIEAFRQFLTIDETAIVLQQAQVVRDAYLLESGEREVAIVDSEDVNRHSSHVFLQSSALNQGLDEGFLIHDGKGDDFVMV